MAAGARGERPRPRLRRRPRARCGRASTRCAAHRRATSPTARTPNGGRCAGSAAATPRSRGRAGGFERGTGFTNPVRQADAQCLVALHAASGDDHVERGTHSDEAGEPDGAAIDEWHAPAAAEHAERGVAATRRSHHTASLRPPATAKPSTAAITGLSRSMRGRPHRPVALLDHAVAFAACDRLQIGARTERAARASEDRDRRGSSASKPRNTSASSPAVGPSTALRGKGGRS